MAVAPSPMVRRRQLMTELRRLRDEAGLTQDEVASQLDWHPTKVMRIETGRTAPHPNDVRVMLTLFGVTSPEQVSALVKLAQDARQRGWWYSYRDVLLNRYEFFIGLETEASSIRNFELAMIPGLLQTEDYARALISGGPMELDATEVDRRVEVRMTRQQALDRDERPQLWVIVDEAAIRRTVGGPAVMRAQLEALVSRRRPGPHDDPGRCPTAPAPTPASSARSSSWASPNPPSPRSSPWRPSAGTSTSTSPRKSASTPPPSITCGPWP